MHGRCGLFHSGFFDKKGENTMAFKMILAVNFTPDRLKQLKLLGMLTKSQVKAVTEEEKEEVKEGKKHEKRKRKRKTLRFCARKVCAALKKQDFN